MEIGNDGEDRGMISHEGSGRRDKDMSGFFPLSPSAVLFSKITHFYATSSSSDE